MEALAIRIRDAELLQAPFQKRALEEFRDLQHLVAEIDREGARTTREQLRGLHEDAERLEREVGKLYLAIADRDRMAAEERQWSRRMILTALFGALVALGLFVAELIVKRAVP